MDEMHTKGVAEALLKTAGMLLMLLWVASMSLADDRLCSSVPLCLGLAVVVLLFIVSMVLGIRPPRPTLVCLFGLTAGLYFSARCVSGDMLSEIWHEIPLLLGAFVFYGAGYMLAQKRGGMVLTNALLLGVVANVLYLFLLHKTALPQEITGRPTMSMAGANSRGAALFIYKNFAGVFLMMAGTVLLCRPLWVGWKGRGSLLVVLVGLAGIACSFFTGSRAIVALAPLLAVGGWLFWVIIRLYNGQRVGVAPVLTGLLLFVGVAVLVGELFMGNSLLQKILAVDTHERSYVWGTLLNILPQAPWYGHGAGATAWQLVPRMSAIAVPNYAHNEYLQAWMDYGIAGVALMVGVIVAHLAAGFWGMASEEISRGRRALMAACLLVLIAMAASALVDFMWHSFALVGLSAFACGVLASPVARRAEPLFSRRQWAAGSGPALRPVRFMGRGMMAATCVLCVSLAAACGWHGWRLLPAWRAQWQYNSLYHAGASEGERVEFLERVMPFYPDPDLADHYVTLRPPAGRPDDLARMETVLRAARQSNPHQLYTAVMLAEILGREGRYAEAESLLRDSYLPEGQGAAYCCNWPGYYGMNLLGWGCQRMAEGDHASALSMMEYALNIWGYAGGLGSTRSHGGKRLQWRNRVGEAYIAARRVDVDMMRAIGVQKDDSWQQPMRPGGPAALYQRWGNKTSNRHYASPYSRRSPLNP